MQSIWAWHGVALICYVLPAAMFIGQGRSLGRDIAGIGSDPFAFIWFLAWWPWAIAHHVNPLFTQLVWQPVGVDLGWLTSVPLLGLVAWPLTLISPVLAFNVLILLAPVLSAFMAYLLCLSITRVPAAAVIGGFLFGYSSYEMAQDTATLNLSFTLLVPALLLIVLSRLQDRLRRNSTILLAALTLICQFLISIEIFGMIFVLGGLVWALAMVYLPERRLVLRRLVVDALLSAPLVLVVLSPFLISMFRHADIVNLPAAWPDFFAIDLTNFIIPGRMNLLGGNLFSGISGHFPGDVQEQDGYIGLPLLLIILLFAKEHVGRPVSSAAGGPVSGKAGRPASGKAGRPASDKAGRPAAKFLLVVLALLAVLSLGPRLWIAGHCIGAVLPWMLFMHLPLLAGALPARFSLFVSLAAAVMAAIWIAAPAGDRQRRLLLGIAACLFMMPGWHPWTKAPVSQFFQPGRVQAVLGEQARLLILPFAINGPSSFWQVENRFGFVQTGGYLGFPPKPMQIYAAPLELFGGIENAGLAADIAKFCAATRTQFVVMGPGTSRRLQQDIAQLHWHGQAIDDVVVYTVPAAKDLSNG